MSSSDICCTHSTPTHPHMCTPVGNTLTFLIPPGPKGEYVQNRPHVTLRDIYRNCPWAVNYFFH